VETVEFLYIYKFGNRKKDLALDKYRDWLTGLSFTGEPFGQSFKFNVKQLADAGFMVRPDGNQPVTLLWSEDLYIEPNSGSHLNFPQDHVSVWHPDRQYWDEWFRIDSLNKKYPHCFRTTGVFL
jgi:hypothetical protein